MESPLKKDKLIEKASTPKKEKWTIKEFFSVFSAILGLIATVAGSITSYVSYQASKNANDISERSAKNTELSAQPIITSHIDNDTLFVEIKKEHRGINLVDVYPLVSFMEGVISEKSLESMKFASFKYKSDMRRSNCMMDESDRIKCYEPGMMEFLKTLNMKLIQLPDNSDKSTFRSASCAYLFSVSYNDIFGKRQRKFFQINYRGHQRNLSDSTFKERLSNMETLSKADTTLEGALKVRNQLNQNSDRMMPRQKKD